MFSARNLLVWDNPGAAAEGGITAFVGNKLAAPLASFLFF